MIAHHYFSIYGNHIILGNFVMEPNNPVLTSFIQSLNLFNLIKSNTYFKQDGTCVDLFLQTQNIACKSSLLLKRVLVMIII